MPNVTLNGVPFVGTVNDAVSVLRAPQEVRPHPKKIGTLLPMADGTRVWVQRTSGGSPVTKTDWDLIWNRVPEATRAAVRVAFDLNTTFPAIIPDGTFTVQCYKDDYDQDQDIVIPGPVRYFNVKLTIHQP